MSFDFIMFSSRSGRPFMRKVKYNNVINLMRRTVLPSKVKPDRILDCIGLCCPEPIFRTRIELDKMKRGEILEVLADDPAAKEDIKSLVKRVGHELLEFESEGGRFRFLIRKI